MIWKVLFAAVAATSFGIIFNIRGKNLIFTGINGGLGYFLYMIALSNHFESYVGMFASSLAMTIFAEICARLLKAPTSIFLAASLIPIVPGGTLFSCALNLLEGNNELAVADGIKTVLESGSIAIGIIVISSLTKVLVRIFLKKKNYNSNVPGGNRTHN